MSVALVDRAVTVRAALEARERDPIKFWRFGVPRLRDAFRLFTADKPITELSLRSCNKGTKSTTLATVGGGIARKLKAIDGVPMPQWRGPVEIVQLVLDYKQQLLSVQPAWERMLGRWPHHATHQGEALATLEIMPEGGDPNSRAGWSIVHFLSQKNLQSGTGVRADVVLFDEPPVMSILRELRKAAHAGRKSVRVIGFTPTIRKQWAPLREDYGDTPRRMLRRVDADRAEVRWSLDEVADFVLSPEEKAQLVRFYQNDPLKDARIHGDYCNTEGASPWGAMGTKALFDMLQECRDPEIVHCRVVREHHEREGVAGIARIPVEVFKRPEAVRRAYIPIDPASGVDDNHHNPACLHVVEDGTGDLCARWNGYLAPYSVGVLAAVLSRQYHLAMMDVEMKDHWGVNVVRGIQDQGLAAQLCYEQRELRPGEWAKEVGFDQNEETRALIIGFVQEWLDAYAAGIKYANCPSRAVIETLMDCQLDERGRIVAAPGIDHGEDLILRGQSLRRAVTLSHKQPAQLDDVPFRSRDDKLIAMIQGKDVDDDEWQPSGESGLLVPRNGRPNL